MVPIHDTDVAEERFRQAGWENFELWEKIEQRLRRRKRLVIGLVFLAFLLLSSIPPIRYLLPKWRTLSATRALAQQLSFIKKQATRDQMAYRIRFDPNETGRVTYWIEKAPTCKEVTWKQVTSGTLLPENVKGEYALLLPDRGQTLGVPGLADQFCYDTINGSGFVTDEDSVIGFGIIPVKDLSDQRTDRLSLLLVSGKSGLLSFE